MLLPSRASAVSLALFFIFVVPVYAQQQVWSKYYGEKFDDNNQRVARWVDIATVDGAFPFRTRVLYEDATHYRLVFRLVAPTEGASTTSVHSVATGEALTFDVQSNGMTVATGAGQMTILRAECEAYSGVGGSQFPPAVKAQAAQLFNGLSQGFRDALHRHAQVACSVAGDTRFAAAMYAHLFFDDVDCTAPAVRSSPLNRVPAFNPATVSPDAFEQSFGQAYYR